MYYAFFSLKRSVFTKALSLTNNTGFFFSLCLIDLVWNLHLDTHFPKVSGSEIKMKVGRYWSGMKGLL